MDDPGPRRNRSNSEISNTELSNVKRSNSQLSYGQRSNSELSYGAISNSQSPISISDISQSSISNSELSNAPRSNLVVSQGQRLNSELSHDVRSNSELPNAQRSNTEIANAKTSNTRQQQNTEDVSDLRQRLLSMNKNDLFELTLTQVGGFGSYQVILWCVGLVASFLAAFNHFGIIFIAYTPSYQCVRDGIHTFDLDENKNSSTENKNNDDYLKCGNEEDPCHQWVYDDSLFTSTVVTQFDLVCDRKPLLPLLISSYMVGIITINIFCGFLSDRFGRRRMALIFSVIHICSSFATAFSVNYAMFVGFHVLVGGSIHSIWTCLFVLSTEVMPEPRRVANGAVYNFGWNLGGLTMVLFAYFLRDWSSLQLAFAIFSLGLGLIYFFVPESPRWLLHTGKMDQAEANMKIIAKRNRVKLHKTQFEIHIQVLREVHMVVDKAKLDEETFLQRTKAFFNKGITLLKNTEFCKRLFLMMIVWFVVGCSAYGIHFSVKFVNFDIFVTTAIKEVAIVIMILIFMPIYERMNSALCLMVFYIVGGLLGISFLLIPIEATAARVVVYILCQAVMSGDFYMVDTYTPDLFSTDTRNFAFSLLDAISKLGTTISPFIVDLGGEKNPSAPPAIFGILMITASLVFFFTPNTRGQSLVQNVEDLKWTKGRTIFDSLRRKILRKETLV